MEIFTGALMIGLGVAAIGLPFVTSLSVTFLIACAFGAAGFVHLFGAVMARGVGSIGLELFAGLLYLAIAVAMVTHPLWSITTLALVVSAALAAEGMVALVAPFVLGDAGGSLWLMMSAVVTIAAGFVAWAVSLVIPAVVVAALVGVTLITKGAARAMTAIEESRLRAG